MSDNNNPFNVKIVDVVIKKFNNSDSMSIMPQVLEFVLFQSIYSPILKAQLAIFDGINLLHNYPFSGEETVQITLEQNNENSQYVKDTYTLNFVISAVRKLEISSNARGQSYFVELDSVEAYESAKVGISQAYHDNIEDIIKSVLDEYLKTKKVYYPYESTKKTREIIIPNLRPFAALKWLCKHAVAENSDKYYSYAFYEALDMVTRSSYFVFKPIQKYTYQRDEDEAALAAAKENPYFYISDLAAVRNDEATVKKLESLGFKEHRNILNLKYNKRYSTLEKISGGYFDNEYIEINMLQKDYKITRTTLNEKFTTLHNGILNTNPYVNDLLPPNQEKDPETSGRNRYVINNYDDLNQPSRRDRFGRAARSYLAMSQIDVSADIITNLTTQVGDIMYVNMPEMSGFNNQDLDKYLTGYFIISEMKTIIRSSGETATLLRLNKDSYLTNLADASLYTSDSGSAAFGNPNKNSPTDNPGY